MGHMSRCREMRVGADVGALSQRHIEPHEAGQHEGEEEEETTITRMALHQRVSHIQTA